MPVELPDARYEEWRRLHGYAPAPVYVERPRGGGAIIVGSLLGLGALGLGVYALSQAAKAAAPEKKKTQVTLTVSATSISKGQSIDVDGELKDGEGDPLVGKTLLINISGQEQELGITDGQGQVHSSLTFDLAGSYPLFLTFKGDATYEGSSTSIVTIIVQDPATIVHFEDFTADVTETFFAGIVNFSGTLLNGTNPIEDAEIKIEHKDLLGKIAYSKGKTTSDGRFFIPATMTLCGIAPLFEIRNKAIYSGGGFSVNTLTGETDYIDSAQSVVSPEVKVEVNPTIEAFGFRAVDGAAQGLAFFEGETLVGSRYVEKVFHSAYIPGRPFGNNYYLEKVQSGGLIQIYSKNFNDEKFFVETSVKDTVLGFKMRTQNAIYGYLIPALVEPSLFEIRRPLAKYGYVVTTRGVLFGLRSIPISATSIGSVMFWLLNSSSSMITMKVGYKQYAGGPTIPLYLEQIGAGRRNSLRSVTSKPVINGVTHEGGLIRRIVVNDRASSIEFESDIAGMSELQLLVEYV